MNVLPTKNEIDRIENALKEMDYLINKYSVNILCEKYINVVGSFHNVVRHKKVQCFNDAVKAL